MYDHLPPRLAKYLAQIYTGTDAPEIELKDVRSRVDEFANVQRSYKKVERWNNAHKREIAQLQSKLHDRRVEVKLLLNENDVFSRAIQRRNKKIRELQDEIVAERRKVDALNKCADTYDEINEDLIRAVMQQDVELVDWCKYVQLLIAELNKRDEKIEALGKQYKHKCRSNDALASMLYDRDCEFK